MAMRLVCEKGNEATRHRGNEKSSFEPGEPSRHSAGKGDPPLTGSLDLSAAVAGGYQIASSR